jgi:nucleoside-diphosphate-sugar epimerase
LLTKFLDGKAMIDPENDRWVNHVHRDDIVIALSCLLDQGAPQPEIFNLVDDQPLRQSECYRWLAARLNRPMPAIGQSSTAPKRGASNKRVSNAKLRALGWAPRYATFVDAMEKSVLPSFGL